MENKKSVNLYLLGSLVGYADYIATTNNLTTLTYLKEHYVGNLETKKQSQIELKEIYKQSHNQNILNDIKYNNLYICELETKIKLINLQLLNINKKNKIFNNAKKEINKYINEEKEDER